MTSIDFRKQIRADKVAEATLGECVEAKSKTRSYWFDCFCKEGQVIKVEGFSWEDVLRKIPEWLKKDAK
jgi:hypothetical protein